MFATPLPTRSPSREQTLHRLAAASEAYPCRYGHNKNKPYCDRSHVAAGFEAEFA